MLHAIHEISGPATTLGAAPPPLPVGPAIPHWLFERPITVGLVVGAFALASWVVLSRRGEERRALLVGGALAVIAVSVGAVGSLVETTRERLIRLSNEFVDAVAARETDVASAMLADDLVIAMGGTQLPGGAGLARRALETFHEKVKVTDHLVTDESATGGASGGASQFFVRASSDVGPGTAWFRLSWREGPAGVWKIFLIEVLRVNGRSPEEAGAGLLAG